MEKRLFVPQELIPALLDGTKTMHRVVLKPQPLWIVDPKGIIEPSFQVGSLIWVPETWCNEWKEPDGWTGNYLYKADGIEVCHVDYGFSKSPWISPVTMPREAARIWLEVVSAKVERLWSITEEDARAEGIIDGGCINCGEHEPCGCDNPQPDARDGYIWIWNAHAKPGHGWDANDWVEAIEFRRVER